MKLWYQSLARESDAIHYHPLLRKAIDSCVDPGTTVDIHGVVASAGMGVFYRILRHYDLQEVIKNAIRAENEGYDAFLIGNFSDTGVDEARELLNIPVLGICENSMHLACQMGASFGVVPVSQKQTPGKIENARRYGLERQMVGAEPLNSSPAALKQAMADSSLKEQVMTEFTACAKRLLQRGAEVIVPAGGEFNVFLADEGIFEIDRAPIVNGIIELVKMGEFAVKMKKLTGRYTSKRFHYAPPTGDYLKRVRNFYGADLYPGAK